MWRVAIFLLLASSCSARPVWEEDGFKIETAGWVDQQIFQEWIGVKLLLTIPEDGWLALDGPGSLELYFPKFGWRQDIGVIVFHGCDPDPRTGRDSQGGICGINHDFGCHEVGGKVKMVARMRRFNPTSDNKPTAMRWVYGRKTHGTN